MCFLFRFHYERMDELRMFLENEAFALCPVPLQFTLFDLQVKYLILHYLSFQRLCFAAYFRD